jgi:pilus assembly protein Flp/PilA
MTRLAPPPYWRLRPQHSFGPMGQEATEKPATACLATGKETTMELVRYIKDFAREEDGVTAIEYALLASLIALAIVTTAGALGTQLSNMFTFIKGKIVIS